MRVPEKRTQRGMRGKGDTDSIQDHAAHHQGGRAARTLFSVGAEGVKPAGGSRRESQGREGALDPHTHDSASHILGPLGVRQTRVHTGTHTSLTCVSVCIRGGGGH